MHKTLLQNRGVEDILIACIDNLSGFKEAIPSVFPYTEIQQCIVYQLRNSLRYIPEKEKKAFLSDLKSVYKADTLYLAEHHLLEMSEKWEALSVYFKCPKPIRTIIYTTNTIESFHSQLRKITKTKRVFTSDMALMKLLYLVQENVTKKWSMPMHNWKNAQYGICKTSKIIGTGDQNVL